MPRLPTPGSDSGNWGNILNEYLRVSHREDGKLKGVPEVINVKDFGTKGDGISDDTAAIQAAIDNLESQGGGTLYIPKGTYLISSSLSVENENIHIRGEGRKSILKTNTSITMLFIGPKSGTLTANAGNIIERLHFDLNNTASTGIHWRRWGQIGVTQHIHFTNPTAGAIGIATSSSDNVNELVFDDINYWSGSPAGTAIQIDCNNCKIQNSTIIGASIAIDLSPTSTISPVVISTSRISYCSIGISVNSRAMLGLFIHDMRFESNISYDINAEGFDNINNRIFGISISNIYTSRGVNWRFRNCNGIKIDSAIFKEWTGTSPAILDDGGNSEVNIVNLVKNPQTTVTLLPPNW